MGNPVTVNWSDLASPQGPAAQPQSTPPSGPGSNATPMTVNWSDLSSTGANQTQQPQPQGSDEIQINDSDNLPTKVVKRAGSIMEGIGEGLFGTAAGVSDIVDKVTGQKPGAVNAGLHKLAGDNNAERGTFQSIGYGGETLMEFLLGDEALKALPMSQRLDVVSKWMKTMEKSPKLMTVMKMGAEAMKAASLQGLQTYVKSGGDSTRAVEDAAMAGTIGAGAGAVSAVAPKLGKAARTVLNLSKTAEGAPSESSVFNGLADDLTKGKQSIEDIFSNAKQGAEAARDTALSDAEAARAAAEGGAEADRAAAKKAADETLAGRKDQAEEMVNSKKAKDTETFDQRKAQIETAHQNAQTFAQNSLLKGMDKLAGQNPADAEELSGQLNEAINNYEKQAHEAYEEGINGEEGIATRLKGETLPVADSSISTKAKELLDTPDPGEHPAVIKAMAGAGDKLDARVKDLLTDLSDGTTKSTVTGADGKAVTNETDMEDWTADSLIKLRQSIRKWAAGFERGDLNRQVLGKLINSIDDTLEDLAGHAGDENVMSDYQQLRKNYKDQRALLDSNVADKLRLNNPDKALDDVNKYLAGGSNPLAKLQAVRKMIGDGAMQELGRTQVATWRKLAETDPDKFITAFNKMSDPVREALLGPEANAQLKDLISTHTNLNEFASEQASKLLDEAKTQFKSSTSATRQAFGNTGPGGKQLGGLVGEGYKNAHATQIADIESKYNDAVQSAKDAFDAAKQSAGDTFDATKASADSTYQTNVAPFKESLLKNLADGRDNAVKALRTGQVDAVDIRNLKAAIGPDKWEDISKGIFQRALADASPKGAFDPEKLLNWWNDIKPEVRSEMFNLSDPAKAKQVQSLIDSVSDSAAVKRMVKYVGYPTVAIPAGFAGAQLGARFGMLGEIAGGLLGLGGGKNAIKGVVEWVANHPNTWKTFLSVSENAEKPGVKAAAKGAPFVPAGIHNVFSSLQGSLSQ